MVFYAIINCFKYVKIQIHSRFIILAENKYPKIENKEEIHVINLLIFLLYHYNKTSSESSILVTHFIYFIMVLKYIQTLRTSIVGMNL